MLKRILTAAVLIPVVVALVLFAPAYAVAIAACAVAMVALHEYLGLARAMGADVFMIAPMAATVLMFVTVLPGVPTLLMVAVLAIAAVAMLTQATILRPLQGVLPDAAFSFFGLIYVAFPMATIPHTVQQENGRAQILFMMLVVWTGDIAALYVGRAFGRKKLWPRISPNKTWEGTLGSTAGSLLVGLLTVLLGSKLAAHAALPEPFPGSLVYWLALAVVLNLVAQFGDLLESALKRGAGVKDSGTLLPGHGGVLDRIDAMLLAAPVLWYAQLLQQYFW